VNKLLSGEPAVGVTRGQRVESTHSVAACATTVTGDVIASVGDIATPVFLRSSAKPFIAAAVLREGAVERFGLTPQEIAVMAASHNGEPIHTTAVRSILEKIGASESDLACGAHAPSYEPAARALAAQGTAFSAVHNNCSGKHAGILALARLLGAPLAGYLGRTHPAQAAVIALCERASGEQFTDDRLGVDGCGIPVYATSLRRAARSFARIATLQEFDDQDAAAIDVVRKAMMAHPEYVGGTERFDTELMRATHGTICAKAGAEGVHADAILPLGAGLVLKVIDGNRRAVPAATIALLRGLGALDDAALAALAPFARTSVRNAAGLEVGEIAALTDFGVLTPVLGHAAH